VPSVNAWSAAAELYRESQDVTDSEAPVIFNIISPHEVSERIQDSNGNIDVRNFVRATCVVWTTDHSADVTITGKATSHGDDEDIVASTSVAAGSTQTKMLDAQNIEGIAKLRVDVAATTPGSNGTIKVEVYVI